MTRHRLITPKHNLPGPWPEAEVKASPKPPQRAEDCAHCGGVSREVECRVCPRETQVRPVYRCAIYGEAMNRRNEHGLADCSRCGAFSPRPA